MDDTNALLQSDQTEEVHDNNEETVSDPSDKLTPDHPRFKQVLERAKAAEEAHAKDSEELARIKEELETIKSERSAGGDEIALDEEERLAWNKMEKLLDKRDRERGVLTASQLEERERVENRANSIKELRTKHNGKDGLPVFDDEVIVHAKQKGFGDNYEAAYRDMHFDAIVEVETKRRSGGYTPPSAEVPTSARRVVVDGLTPEAINNLDPVQYERVREKLHQNMKEKAKQASQRQ